MYDQNQSESTYQYAAPIKRFAALFIDGLVVSALSVPIGFVIGVVVAASMQGKDPEGIQVVAQILGNIIGILISWLYFALMESSAKSATLGKMAMGLMVLDTDGYPINFGQATGRYFGKILSALPCYAGFIAAFFNEKKQAWHDSMAQTVVVDTRA
ncbi:MAG: RDD family protein [Armatimonadota bacterium]